MHAHIHTVCMHTLSYQENCTVYSFINSFIHSLITKKYNYTYILMQKTRPRGCTLSNLSNQWLLSGQGWETGNLPPRNVRVLVNIINGPSTRTLLYLCNELLGSGRVIIIEALGSEIIVILVPCLPHARLDSIWRNLISLLVLLLN